MAYDTVIQQGYFTSDGTDKIIPLRSDADWVEVINLTNIAASTQWASVRWYWQRGMTNDDAVNEFHATADQVISMSTSAVGFNGATYRGISLIDTSAPYTFTQAITAGTNATQPLYSTADTDRLIPGAIVRIYGTDQTDVNGLDFSVDTITADTSFRLANALQQAPGIVAGAAGTWKYVAPNATVYNIWNPKKRVIGNITGASPAVVTTLVDHGYTTGQKVKMRVSAACGMTELDGQEVTVTYINASTFSIGVDTTGYTAFAFPLPAAVPFTPAEVIPFGEDLQYNYLDSGAQENTGFIGIILGTSATGAVALGSPGGTANDAIKWRAGKSFAYDIG